MGQLTLSPEMLPCTDFGEAEVKVCVGPPKCDGQNGPCAWCQTVVDNNTVFTVASH